GASQAQASLGLAVLPGARLLDLLAAGPARQSDETRLGMSVQLWRGLDQILHRELAGKLAKHVLPLHRRARTLRTAGLAPRCGPWAAASCLGATPRSGPRRAPDASAKTPSSPGLTAQDSEPARELPAQMVKLTFELGDPRLELAQHLLANGPNLIK